MMLNKLVNDVCKKRFSNTVVVSLKLYMLHVSIKVPIPTVGGFQMQWNTHNWDLSIKWPDDTSVLLYVLFTDSWKMHTFMKLIVYTALIFLLEIIYFNYFCKLLGLCILMLMFTLWMILWVLWMQMLEDICLTS